MNTNLFVKLDEFERELTIKDYEDVVTVMRYLMNREYEIVRTLPGIKNHSDKIVEYKRKTESLIPIPSTRRKILRNPEAIKISDVELMWTIGLSSDGHIAFISLIAIGNVHSLVTEPFAVFRPFRDETARRAIVVHTHPTEVNVQASPSDLAFTKKLIYTANNLHILFADHVVIGTHGEYSMLQHKNLDALDKQLYYEQNGIAQLSEEHEQLQADFEKYQQEAAENLIASVKLMKKAGLNIKDIAEATGFSKEEIERL